MGLATSKQIAKIIVDPVDFNVVYVASLGDLWAAGGERGVYKTTDGGVTWNRVLHVDDDTGATELVMDPSNNKTLYAATYQRRRQQWGMNGGGPGSNIWKTTDGGVTWAKLEIGHSGRTEGPHRPRRSIAAIRTSSTPRVEHETESGVYRTDNAGATWRKLSDTNPRPMYFGVIKIDPQTDSRIYVLGVSLHVSDDGGRTFRADGAERIHVDHHALWINPRDPRHLIIGNDGGVSHFARSIARPGCGCRTCSARRRITSSSTCRRRITSAPACRTTTPGADRARCAPTAASSTTTGM